MNWLSNNKGVILAGIATVALAAGFLFASGCSLGDIIQVKVPTGIQQSLAAPSQVPLNESSYTWDSWVQFVEHNSQQLQDNIDRSNFVWGMLSSAVNVGAESAQGPLAALPGGTFMLSGLTLLTGLFLNKPGAAKATAKEKEKSFNAGLKAGEQAAAAAKNA